MSGKILCGVTKTALSPNGNANSFYIRINEYVPLLGNPIAQGKELSSMRQDRIPPEVAISAPHCPKWHENFIATTLLYPFTLPSATPWTICFDRIR